jgi:hypothetical protein
LYCLPNVVWVFKSRRIVWAGHVAQVEKKKNAYRVLVGKHEGKKELTTWKYKLEDNIKIVLKDVGWNGMDWSGLA